MPNSTVMTDVQYWQTYARIKRASIGIKIWLFLHTPYYSNTFNTEKKAINNFNNIK
jgi:ribosomal protein S3